MLKSILSDVLFIVGASSTAFGIYQMHPPAAFIFIGLLLLATGVLMSYKSKGTNK